MGKNRGTEKGVENIEKAARGKGLRRTESDFYF